MTKIRLINDYSSGAKYMYRKYDQSIKEAIIKTKNINLFPDLNIPRTTASYWIKKSKNVETTQVQKSIKNQLYRKNCENELLQELLRLFIQQDIFFSLESLSQRKKFVEIFESFSPVINKTKMLKSLGLSLPRYQRLKIEHYGCSQHLAPCDPSRPNQLTKEEQSIMMSLAKSKKHAHLSIKSLMLLAQRDGILFCGYDSWLKYLKINNVQRIKIKPRRKKIYKKGLRAHHPNEFWHIDIAEIQAFGEKYYLQVLQDNYSRLVINYQLTNSKNANVTIKSIKKSLSKFDRPIFLMSDGGGENIAKDVTRLVIGHGIKQIIAKKDLHYSNSMIESFFRKLKNSVDFSKTKTEVGIRRKITWFINQYNNCIPHFSLDGALPIEVYSKSFSIDEFKEYVQKNRKQLIQQRTAHYKACQY